MTSHLDGISARAQRLADKVRTATRYRRAAIAFGAGALSVLSMAPFFASPVLFLTMPILVWLIDGAAAEPAPHGASGEGTRNLHAGSASPDGIAALKSAAAAGWFFGFGYFVFGMFWIGEAFLVESEKFAWLLPAAVTLLPGGLALFFALAAALARLLWREGSTRILVLATAVGITEGLRGHVLTGLPWNTLGYALTYPLTLMQSAGLVGIYALSVLAVIVFAAPLVVLADASRPVEERTARTSRPWPAISGIAIAVCVLAVLWAYGTSRLNGDAGARIAGVNLRIVQPSVPQRDKWQPEKQREIFDLHIALSRQNPSGIRDDLKGITHVIWPEAAMPFLPLETPQALKEIGDLLPNGVHLISGALRVEWPDGHESDGAIPRTTNEAAASPAQASSRSLHLRRAFNSLMAFGPEGGLVAVYDKIHLVPFGEYLPLQNLLESMGLEQLTRIRGGFTTGRNPRPLIDVPGLPPLIGLVCYEAIFPGAVVQSEHRPSLIVNVTNDGWFGNTTGPRQHFHMARVRAVEEGVPLIRAANNGISALIDPYGRTLALIGLNVRGVADTRLPVAAPAPLYVWWGELIHILYIVTSLGWFAGSIFSSRAFG